jgi:hypothetical protein
VGCEHGNEEPGPNKRRECVEESSIPVFTKATLVPWNSIEHNNVTLFPVVLYT